MEPTFGLGRTILAVLLSAYREDGERIILSLSPKIAPYKVAVFPLVSNKPQLVEKARTIYNELRKNFSAVWDDRGNIGKRYYSEDEIGTPWCVTIDYQTLEDGTVTVRERDTGSQDRIDEKKLDIYFKKRLS